MKLSRSKYVINFEIKFHSEQNWGSLDVSVTWVWVFRKTLQRKFHSNSDQIKSLAGLYCAYIRFLMNGQRFLSMIRNKNKSLLEKGLERMNGKIKNNLIPCQTLKTQCAEFYFTNNTVAAVSLCFDSEGRNEERRKGRLKVAWEPVEIASYWYRQIKIETEKY